MYNHTITLNSGVKIPQLGLGTWFIDDSKVADISLDDGSSYNIVLKWNTESHRQ